MRRYSLIVLMFVVSLVTASSAQAVVVNDAGTTAGVALVPGSSLPGGVTATSSGGPCSDPWLSGDFGGPIMAAGGLCYHGGSVIHRNEIFALTWDPQRVYWQTTRGYVEGFLRNVAAGSNTLTSPFALSPQYQDAGGRASNDSRYGGGCVDFGGTGGATCQFGSSNGSGAGNNYPASGCPTTGTSYNFTGANGVGPNLACLTDAQVRTELNDVISKTGILGHTQPGYTPVVTLLTPPGVETCLDSSGTLCSANSTATGTFCSYHSHVNVGGTEVAYVVQPWTPYKGCDEPNLNPLVKNPTPQQVSEDAGLRLVSPLSAGTIASIVNPGLDGWYALDGSEINDNGGCAPAGKDADSVAVGNGSYVIQREFNNAGALAFEPNTYFGCAPNVLLTPAFVVPSAVNQGDTVELDGSATASTLLVPKANYQWDFGDGTSGVGPSVEHIYGTGGSYTVKLTVTDRGGNTQALTQPIQVLGATGQPVTTSSSPSGSSSSNSGGNSGLVVHLQLMPQGLRAMLRSGVAVVVSSNEPAAGLVYVSISRATAKRMHMKLGRSPLVAIGRGTVSGIKAGSQHLHLHLRLSQAMTNKLGALGHVTLTIRLALVDSGAHHFAVDAAARY
jgi:hypothetical protein